MKFLYMEAAAPPIKNKYVIDMLFLASRPSPTMRQMLMMGPPPMPADWVRLFVPVRFR